MVAVHSRIGLTFTALVEIAVSTVTSLSVCALVGFKVTMVPWCVQFFYIFLMAQIDHLFQGAITDCPSIRRSGEHVQPSRRGNPHIHNTPR